MSGRVVSTLASLPVGARATLAAPTHFDATVLRLLEMGMTRGTAISVTRRAPLGDPIEIALRGTRLCLRRSVAAFFPVEAVEAP